jgi:hypothetical protein
MNAGVISMNNDLPAKPEPVETQDVPGQRPRPMLIPWRLKTDEASSLRQHGDDVGCGNGPVF